LFEQLDKLFTLIHGLETMGKPDEATLSRLKEKAFEIARVIADPVFYRDKTPELERAETLEKESELVNYAISVIKGRGDVLGHGYQHARKVAIESAAIIFSERGINRESVPLAEKGLIAGYLHDIERDQKNHPEKGAVLAARLLADKIDARGVEMITFAIRNHEAFKKHETVDDGNFMLLSGSLYDADKFRWGPDNFLFTLWDMAGSMNLTLDLIVLNYQKGVEGIKRISETFRTATGRCYGPDFSRRGLEIGEELYRCCAEETRKGA